MESRAYDKLYEAVVEILNDFDTYGEVLQTDENGEYGDNSPIEKLREAWAYARVEREKQ